MCTSKKRRINTMPAVGKGWWTFNLTAYSEGELLQIRLEYFEDSDKYLSFPVPSEVFAVVRKIVAAADPKHPWGRMYFDFMLPSKYDVKYRYDEGSSVPDD